MPWLSFIQTLLCWVLWGLGKQLFPVWCGRWRLKANPEVGLSRAQVVTAVCPGFSLSLPLPPSLFSLFITTKKPLPKIKSPSIWLISGSVRISAWPRNYENLWILIGVGHHCLCCIPVNSTKLCNVEPWLGTPAANWLPEPRRFHL